jgi:hypothetical protein
MKFNLETLKKVTLGKSGNFYVNDIKTQVSEKGFNYFTIPVNYYRDQKVWVNKNLVKDEIINNNAEFVITDKKSRVLKPGNKKYVLLYVEEGYRGSSNIKNIENGKIVESGFEYASQRGNLGIGEIVLIEIEKFPCNVEFSRNGRLYGGIGEGVIQIEEDNIALLCEDEPSDDIVEELE